MPAYVRARAGRRSLLMSTPLATRILASIALKTESLNLVLLVTNWHEITNPLSHRFVPREPDTASGRVRRRSVFQSKVAIARHVLCERPPLRVSFLITSMVIDRGPSEEIDPLVAICVPALALAGLLHEGQSHAKRSVHRAP